VKKTETRIRVWQDGTLVSDTTTTTIERPRPTTDVLMGFQMPVDGE
jgi:hypothetical protein